MLPGERATPNSNHFPDGTGKQILNARFDRPLESRLGAVSTLLSGAAMTQNQMLRRETEGSWSYAYFSLIDPSSKDLSYGTITDHPYL
jgi:hypothetical protein